MSEAYKLTQDPVKVALLGKRLDDVYDQLVKDGTRFRISKIDGVAQPMTRDFVEERLNLDVNRGVIVNIRYG